MVDLSITAGTLVTGDDRVPVGPGWVRVRDGRILEAGVGRPGFPVVVDLPDAVVVPGFVDLHVHGGGGASFPGGDPVDALRALALHRAHGTTTSLASLVSDTPAALDRAVAALSELVVDGELAGLHLEGPWLASARCGAHDPSTLRDPDPAEIARLLRRGTVAMVTLAPERPGGLDAVRQVAGAGVVAAVGHTDASYALVVDAIGAGVRVGTHLFNAMAPLGHREPGPAAALLGDPRVTVEVIADGVHVHPAVVSLVLATAPNRVAAVTDAMSAAGTGDGDHRLGPLDVRVRDGVARLAGRDTIAGSTATGDVLFRRLVAGPGSPPEPGTSAWTAALARAVDATSTAPARVLGRDDVGRLAPGSRADLVVLDRSLQVRTVYRGGAEVPPFAPTAADSSPGRR
ncbi:N-acetylglucosamine 6-phosphate deacetylase [Pseudonocardia sediminis]|uniref:N-acetylglucosamine 6-phosphate deacetylase n=1 Tax=Pseudonocardia sediminis TaxID=1397368 RepID=A0A4Q7V1B7_PSEST|nr:amidohydrolase family protein [Pseudonocardia sediminis]RZT86349.1 N-acetylglucosamine 6-phosphate deacetylase [Pseudonocardia sediminis]